MISSLRGYFYNYPKLEIAVPDVADVTNENYIAKSFTKQGVESEDPKLQQSFYICHPVSLQMTVETWLGKIVENWIFEPGKDPVQLRKIFKTPAPVIVDADGNPTETEVTKIQVGY